MRRTRSNVRWIIVRCALEQVADHAERRDHHRRVEEHRAEDQRLDVAGAAALDVGDEEADPDGHRAEPEQRRGAPGTRAAARTAQ